MHVLTATIQLKPENREAFIKAFVEYARDSVDKEPEVVLRFDILQDSSDPNRIHLYEVYRDEAGWEAHCQTPHVQKVSEILKELHPDPIVGNKYTNIFPPDDAWR